VPKGTLRELDKYSILEIFLCLKLNIFDIVHSFDGIIYLDE